MEAKKTIKVFVLADFANLTEKQFKEVVNAVKKEYPDVVVLPMFNSKYEKDPNEVYQYYVCTIEPIMFSKRGVKVIYTGLHTKKIKTILAIELKK